MSEPSIYDIIINPECLASLLDLALTIGSGNSLYLWDKERFVVAEVAWTVFFIGSFVVLMGLKLADVVAASPVAQISAKLREASAMRALPEGRHADPKTLQRSL